MRCPRLLTALFVYTLIAACSQPGENHPSTPASSNHDSLKSFLLATIANYDAIVGVSVIELETGDTLTINNHIRFPMQSVYKFPLALAVLSDVEKGKVSLKQNVTIPRKMLDAFSWSPLKNQNPGKLTMSVDSLLMYAIAYSDNLACDLLFEVIGGTDVANSLVQKLGYPNIHIRHLEAQMGEDGRRMHANSTIPSEMTGLLKDFFERKILSDSGTKHLLNYMINDSTSHKRILGNLPPGTKVAHKTGTGSVNDTLIAACNDVGIIYLPKGNHLAVAFFVMDAKETIENTEQMIATLSKQVFDYYNK